MNRSICFLLFTALIASGASGCDSRPSDESTSSTKGPSPTRKKDNGGQNVVVSANESVKPSPVADLDLGLSPSESSAVVWWESLSLPIKRLYLGNSSDERTESLLTLNSEVLRSQGSNLERAQQAVTDRMMAGDGLRDLFKKKSMKNPTFDSYNDSHDSRDYHDQQAENDNYAHATRPIGIEDIDASSFDETSLDFQK